MAPLGPEVAPSAAYTPEAWHTFFATAAAAAATLTGLFFIAFSLRVSDLQRSLIIRTRARYLLFGLVGITVGSGVVLIPEQPLTALGVEVLVSVLGYLGIAVVSLMRAVRREPLPLPADLIVRYVAMAISCALILAAGISLIVQAGGGLYLLAFAMLIALTIEVASAWSLVIGIGQDTRPTVGGVDATRQLVSHR